MKENLYETNCIRTSTGRYLDVFNPDPEMIHIEDIANGLSQMPRFAGQLPVFYSVAQHSIRCCQKSKDPILRKSLLLHDASEAYLCDIPKPIKNRLPDYQKLEENLMKVIAEKFGIGFPLSPSVKDIDRLMLEEEWNALMMEQRGIDCMDPCNAKWLFLKYYDLIFTPPQP